MTTNRIRDGIIMISDFSGFTEFVYNTQFYTGKYIVRELLSALIEANHGYFYISEIEGDAILFYKYKKKPSYKDAVTVLKKMHDAFNSKITELSKLLNVHIELNIKFIVHYGQFSSYHIRKFSKLYGKAVVETHVLLKNAYAKSASYIFFSEMFLAALKDSQYKVSDNVTNVPKIGVIYDLPYRDERYM